MLIFLGSGGSKDVLPAPRSERNRPFGSLTPVDLADAATSVLRGLYNAIDWPAPAFLPARNQTIPVDEKHQSDIS